MPAGSEISRPSLAMAMAMPVVAADDCTSPVKIGADQDAEHRLLHLRTISSMNGS